MGIRDSHCSMSERNDTTTSGAEINLSRHEKDETNHLVQGSHLMVVSKSIGMNGFCGDHTTTGSSPSSPLYPIVLQFRSIMQAVE